MYTPAHFKVEDRAEAARMIAAYPFGMLVTVAEGQLFPTWIPFLYEAAEGPQGTLYGHVARANPQWRDFDGVKPALASFIGPHGYISPAWYETPQAVPTWNYVAVNAHGAPHVLEAPATRAMLDRLVAANETGPAPWSTATLGADFIAGMIRGIVAFAMPVTKIEMKAKLSQNKPAGDILGAAAALCRGGNAVLAELMEKARP